jgi:DnaD/phage-associated family protein
MERVRLTPPGERNARGAKARLYFRWMPHLGAEAVALYELLRVLPDFGRDVAETAELAELLRSTPEAVEDALSALLDAGFVVEEDGWLRVLEQPPVARPGVRITEPEVREAEEELRGATGTDGAAVSVGGTAPPARREVEVVRAEPEGVSADDYFRYMGSVPPPHVLEFLNGYCGRDGMEPGVVVEALKIACERDARKVGYVRSILERWVERGVKTRQDVERFESERRLRLVEESGAVRGGALKLAEAKRGGEVRGGEDRGSAARRREGYEWLFGE